MGCSQSKRVEATAVEDVYRPAPASFAIFDINAIDEPWVKLAAVAGDESVKPKGLPEPILQKLDKWELDADAPQVSWLEVSKALEDLKPTLDKQPVLTDVQPPPSTPAVKKTCSSKYTINELDAKLAGKTDPDAAKTDVTSTTSFKSLRENSFILRDKLEREKEGKPWKFAGSRRDILAGFPDKCPPGGAEAVVLYTTTLRGVRQTFDDCQKVRQMLEVLRVAVDERDVALHGEYLHELRELLGEEAAVPRLFVKGRYIGGAEEVAEMNETGRLRWVVDAAGRGKGEGRRGCEGCGGARFVPCMECSGSCKVVGEDGQGWERCGKCNENGLAQCPLCV